MKAVVFTLGCKVNSCESSALLNGLMQKGYTVSDKLEYADLYIINTCAVTAEAEKKSRQALARVKKLNPNARIMVCGCASQHNPQVFFERGAKVVTGTFDKDKILDFIQSEGIFIEENQEYYEKYLPCKNVRTRAYVKIQDGCDNYCSYCLIPYLRGRSRSRKIENIVKEIEYLNPVEVVITGINVSAFDDDGKKLPELLEALKDFDVRVRFGSLEMNVIDDKFLLATKKLKNFAPHFHLSLQSGSDAVLKAMNRKYTADEYYKKVQLIRSYYSDAGITTDVIVGYSAESEQNFEESYNFCKKVAFSDIHCFPYSVREGTEGAKLKKISDDVKKVRLEKMLALKQVLKQKFIDENIGKVYSFVPEEVQNGYVVGYTSNYVRAYIKCDYFENEVKVKLVKPYLDGSLCEIVK